MYEYGMLKPDEVILRSGRGKRDNHGGYEQNHGTLYAYMKMSQQKLLYNYLLYTNKNIFKRTGKVRLNKTISFLMTAPFNYFSLRAH
jgi:hypothetical protein